MDVGPIPFTAIADYFRIYELSEFSDFDEFAYIIRLMDRVHLAESDAERAKGDKSGGNNANQSNKNKG